MWITDITTKTDSPFQYVVPQLNNINSFYSIQSFDDGSFQVSSSSAIQSKDWLNVKIRAERWVKWNPPENNRDAYVIHITIEIIHNFWLCW